MVMNDYKERKYLSSIESAKYLGLTVQALHGLIKKHKIKNTLSAGGQKRFNLKDLKNYEKKQSKALVRQKKQSLKETLLKINNTQHRIYIKSAVCMSELKDNSIHLMVTSPPLKNLFTPNQVILNPELIWSIARI